MYLATRSPTDRELEIMEIVWRLESATVRQVYETLLKKRQTAYTTVMTIMSIVEQKGFFKRRQEGRAYIYTPADPQKKIVGGTVRDFIINRAFKSSAVLPLLHLVEYPHLASVVVSGSNPDKRIEGES